VTDRQLEALLERIDRLTDQVARINRRLEASEGLVLVGVRAGHAVTLAGSSL